MELNINIKISVSCGEPDTEKERKYAIRLRPHHLLCTQGYSGVGYDDTFKTRMDEVVHRLRTEEQTPVMLVFSTDDLCSACPNRLGEDLCRTNEKVKALDQKTAECFHLEEKTYIYQNLVRIIRKTITPEVMDYICGDCSWYPVSACREQVLGSGPDQPSAAVIHPEE